MAGVHSTVWIFAISAALISRALLEQLLVRPAGVRRRQPVADRVVLACEDGEQQPEAEPTSRARLAELASSSAGSSSSPFGWRSSLSLPPVAGARRSPGAVCPSGRSASASHQGVSRLTCVGGALRSSAGRVGSGTVRGMSIGSCGKSSPGGSGTSMGWLLSAAAVTEPVAGHELDPGRREHVQRLGRLEAVACEQLPADHARVGRHQLRHRVRIRPPRSGRCARTGCRRSPMAG